MSGKACKSCGRHPLLEQFSCRACPPQASEESYDLCFECSWNCAREAHTGKRGEDHDFQLYRTDRMCDQCNGKIETDFLMCIACRQDNACYDLCLTCVLGGDGMERHKAMTSHEHVFRQVIRKAHIPQKVAQPFTTHERWWCNVCAQQITQSFFHCQACGTGSSGFDMCISCSDGGGLFRHGAAPFHQFLHVSPSFVPTPLFGNTPFPPLVPDLPADPDDTPPAYTPISSASSEAYPSSGSATYQF